MRRLVGLPVLLALGALPANARMTAPACTSVSDANLAPWAGAAPCARPVQVAASTRGNPAPSIARSSGP
jgi:hypothetical protein